MKCIDKSLEEHKQSGEKIKTKLFSYCNITRSPNLSNKKTYFPVKKCPKSWRDSFSLWEQPLFTMPLWPFTGVWKVLTRGGIRSYGTELCQFLLARNLQGTLILGYVKKNWHTSCKVYWSWVMSKFIGMVLARNPASVGALTISWQLCPWHRTFDSSLKTMGKNNALLGKFSTYKAFKNRGYYL